MAGPVSPLAPTVSGPPPPQPRNAAEAAEQFEALLIAQMLRTGMQKPDGDAETGMETMLDVAADQFARLLAAQGGLGLAKLIAAKLE